jgi:hypothetical protein
MTRTSAPYDATAVELVVRTLRAVAEATPIDPAPANRVDGDGSASIAINLDANQRRRRWSLLMAAAGVLILVAGWAAVLLRDDDDVTEIRPADTTVEPTDPQLELPTPPESESVLPPGVSTSVLACSSGLLVASNPESGLVLIPGAADPPLVPATAMAGVNSTWHGGVGSQAVEIHFPGTQVDDLGERTETVSTVWGEATVWYAPYGTVNAVQIRVPTTAPGCSPGDWDVTVHGPDETANRNLAVELVSGSP